MLENIAYMVLGFAAVLLGLKQHGILQPAELKTRQ
jgi:hypothetical protein